MKIKTLILAVSASVAATFCANASFVTITNRSFEGATANFSFPLTGTVNDTFGAWNFQLSALVSVVGGAQVGTAAQIGGAYTPAPVDGTNEVAIKFPVGVAVDAALSETLSAAWQPNSTYTLKAYVASSTTVSVLSGSTLALKAGSTTQASLSVASLASLFAVSNVYAPVTLTYKTGNAAPTGKLGISLDFPNVAQVGGTIYVDDFSLTVVPNNVVVTATATNSVPGGRALIMAGTGGAPSETYNVISYTNNLNNGVTNWPVFATGQFDVNGNFTYKIPINTNEPARFFRVQLP